MLRKEVIIASVMALLVVLLAVYALYTPSAPLEPKPNNPVAVVSTNMGNFSIELYENKVPELTDHFIHYVSSDFYANTAFHSIYHPLYMNDNGKMVPTEGSMIIGGLYESDGRNLTLKKDVPYVIDYSKRTDIKGIDLTHEDLMVSWLHNNSLDQKKIYSQFYICNGNDLTGYGAKTARLDAHDPVFGKVISGASVIRAIARTPVHSEYDIANHTGDANLTEVPDDPIIIEHIKIVYSENIDTEALSVLPGDTSYFLDSQNLTKLSTILSTKLCLYVMSTFATLPSSST